MQKIDNRSPIFTEDTSRGTLCIHHTPTFGRLLSINEEPLLAEEDGFFSAEMLVHPALFSHRNPEKIAVIGFSFGILSEVFKHPNVKEVWIEEGQKELTERLSPYFPNLLPKHLLNKCQIYQDISELNETSPIDIIIQNDMTAASGEHLFKPLNEQGLAVIPYASSLLELQLLKKFLQALKTIGFKDIQTLHFPEPSHPKGTRTLLLSSKEAITKRLREKEIFNRQFTTRYYNFDIHKAALALPEFVREALI